MNIMTQSISFAALSAAALLTACGDPLLTAQDRGDPVFEFHALVQNIDGAPVSADYQLAVLYLRAYLDYDTKGSPDTIVETELRGAVSIVSPPARLGFDLSEVPQVYPWLEDVLHTTERGQVSGRAFTKEHPPDGVRVGQVVVGPRDELAKLPARIEMRGLDVFSRTLKPALDPYLPNTTVTGYQVVYAEGVSPDDLLYPAYAGAPITIFDGKPVPEGFTLLDGRAHEDAVAWRECLLDVGYPTLDLVALDLCMAPNLERINCVDRCSQASCQEACVAAFPDQLDRDTCLTQAELPKTAAKCGPARTAAPYLMRVLGPADDLSITLGLDDIRDGLWPPQ